jgi:GNAT superfamily N-acetyltransferase
MPANPSPLTAPTADDFRAWHQVQSAALAHDRPGEPVPSLSAVRARLSTYTDGSRLVLWLVRGQAGDPVATALLRLFEDPARAAELVLTVHPAHRRMGTGSRLLATAVEAATEAGCGTVATEVTAGTSGEGFVRTRDFAPSLRLTWQRLVLDDIPEQIRKLPQVPHPGYRLTAWEGVAPDPFAQSLATARSGMDDTPRGDLAVRGTTWDVARVREIAELAAGRGEGEQLLTVAAIDDGDGTVAGYTKLVLPGPGGTGQGARVAQQYDTAVLPAHRGHGLGLWMKAEMLRLVLAGHPGLAEIHTDIADDNRHMLAVNTALGFRPLRRSIAYQLRLTAR